MMHGYHLVLHDLRDALTRHAQYPDELGGSHRVEVLERLGVHAVRHGGVVVVNFYLLFRQRMYDEQIAVCGLDCGKFNTGERTSQNQFLHMATNLLELLL